MNKKGTIHFKGQLKLYMQWPVVMTILLIAMNIWIYMVDQSAGFLMSIFVIIYAIIAFILYVNNRSLIFAELVEFATQYSGVQDILLRELAIPYAILMDDGKILWGNSQLCAQLRVCSQAGGIPVYPRFSQPDNSESWDDAGNGI